MLYPQSFNRLEIGLGLYRRMGFVDSPSPIEMMVLGRTEAIMRKSPSVLPSPWLRDSREDGRGRQYLVTIFI